MDALDALSVAYLKAVKAGNHAQATALLDEMFDSYGQALAEQAERLDEAAEALQGLFESAAALYAE